MQKKGGYSDYCNKIEKGREKKVLVWLLWEKGGLYNVGKQRNVPQFFLALALLLLIAQFETHTENKSKWELQGGYVVRTSSCFRRRRRPPPSLNNRNHTDTHTHTEREGITIWWIGPSRPLYLNSVIIKPHRDIYYSSPPSSEANTKEGGPTDHGHLNHWRRTKQQLLISVFLFLFFSFKSTTRKESWENFVFFFNFWMMIYP